MTVPTPVAYLIVTALVAVTAYVPLRYIPSVATSLFRHHLWRIRDQITMDVRSGALPVDAAVQGLRDEIDVRLRYARKLTAYRLLIVALIARGRVDAPRAAPSASSLRPDQVARLDAYSAKVGDLTTRHVIWGSPSGWLLLPAYLLGLAFQKQKTPTWTGRVVRVDRRREDVLRESRSVDENRPLSTCV